MARIVVVSNDDGVPLDLLEPLLPQAESRRGADGLPAFGSFDALVVLGGQMSVEDVEVAPWLPELGQLMVDCARSGVPVLAICLGAQLLAKASGGVVEVDAWAGPERGVVPVTLRPCAAHDPTLGRIQAVLGDVVAVPSMHADAVRELPSEAIWLASSADYPFHAFRIGSALAVQFHPEAGEQTMLGWAEEDGIDPQQISEQFDRHRDQLDSLARLIAEGFIEEIAAAARRR